MVHPYSEGLGIRLGIFDRDIDLHQAELHAAAPRGRSCPLWFSGQVWDVRATARAEPARRMQILIGSYSTPNASTTFPWEPPWMPT
jgi:hypothetical protein